jgi:hypothetical protein
MKYFSKIQLFIFLTSIGLYSSCLFCQEKVEPSLQFWFQDSISTIHSNTLYNEISVLGLKKTIPVDSNNIILPINPRATEMTYVFIGKSGNDTLKFSYRMVYEYNERCKYTSYVADMVLDSASTFKNVQLYSSYVQITL